MKKIFCLLLSLVMMVGVSTKTLAADGTPVLTLVYNEYDSAANTRVIKIKWDGPTSLYQIQYDDDANFESPVTKTNRDKRVVSYIIHPEDKDATYYIRVRAGKNGVWSNTVVADINKLIESEPSKPYFNIPKIPSIPKLNIKFNL